MSCPTVPETPPDAVKLNAQDPDGQAPEEADGIATVDEAADEPDDLRVTVTSLVIVFMEEERVVLVATGATTVVVATGQYVVYTIVVRVVCVVFSDAGQLVTVLGHAVIVTREVAVIVDVV